MNKTKQTKLYDDPSNTEMALQNLVEAWIDERGCSRLVAAGYAAKAATDLYNKISNNVNTP